MLMRVDILDIATGVCLFEYIREWSGNANSESTCVLIRTMYQLSNSLEVKHILFEKTVSGSFISHENHKYITPSSMRQRTNVTSTFVHLITEVSNGVAGAAFFDSSDDRQLTRIFLRDVLATFFDQYENKLKGLRADLDTYLANIEKKVDKTFLNFVLSEFSSFDISSLLKKHPLHLTSPKQEEEPLV